MNTQIWLFFDGLCGALLCNVVGGPAVVRLNPVLWGTDVISIDSNGKIEHRPEGTNGSNEQFIVKGNKAFVNPANAQQSYGYVWENN